MKIKLLMLAVLPATAAGFSVVLAQTKRSRPAREFMREKLELSPRVEKSEEGIQWQ